MFPVEGKSDLARVESETGSAAAGQPLPVKPRLACQCPAERQDHDDQ